MQENRHAEKKEDRTQCIRKTAFKAQKASERGRLHLIVIRFRY